MAAIVVTCHPDGSVETVLKDQVFDVRKVFGVTSRRVERISEILPTKDGMRFYIKWLRGPLAGTTFSVYPEWSELGAQNYPTYEAAVEAEVEAINLMRLEGHSFN